MATPPTDYDALADQHGLTITDGPPSAPKPNYDALAKQFGLTLSTKPPAPDYDGLAKQFGLTISDIPQAPAPPLPPELVPDRPSLAQLRAEGKLNPPNLPPTDGPTIGPAAPSGLDYMRRFLLGGPNRETALGRAFPSMSGAKVSDTPNSELPLVAPEELIPSESQLAGANLAPEIIPGVSNPLATPTSRAGTRGVAQAATELTKPQNLEIMAATEGLGALTPATGYTSVLGKSINTALGLYFANEMRKGATEAAKRAYAQHLAGDDEGAAQSLGYGSLSAMLGALGLAHGVRSVRGILDTPVPQPEFPDWRTDVWSSGHSGSTAPPRPASATTINVENAAPSHSLAELPPPETTEISEPPSPSASQTAKPNKVDRVSPATPNPPTAAVQTTPESPDTIALQLQQLEGGQRKAVMLPKGTPAPETYPEGTAVTSDAFGNVYVFRPDLTSRAEIKCAAKNNKLSDLLGSADAGMGAPDKTALQGEPTTVVARSPDGTEAQSTATDQANLPATIAATQQVTPPGGSLSIEPPEQVLADRRNEVPAPPLVAPSQVVAPQPPALAPTVTPPQRTYEEVQAEIDRAESELDRNGDQRLLMPASDFEGDSIAAQTRRQGLTEGRYGVMPPELEALYQERDAIQRQDDTEFDHAIGDRLKSVVPDETLRTQLVRQITETAKEPALRDRSKDTLQGMGRVANTVLQHVAGHVTDEPENHWEEVDALPAGTADQPSVQLRRKTGPAGYAPYTERTYTEAQKILDALMEGNAPQYPRRELNRQRAPEATALPATPVADLAAPKALDSPEPESPRRVTPQATGEGTKYVLPSFVTAGIRSTSTDLASPESVEAEKYDFASTQANLSGPVAKALRNFGARIPSSKLAEDGRETQPHITVKYGLHGNDPAGVAKVLQNEPPITASLGKMSLFSNDDADVLKIDVDSPDLHRLNKKIADALPHTDTHPDYQPHATIAYLKPGEGKAYAGKPIPGVTGQTVTLDHISFSGKNGEQVAIPLGNSTAAEDLATPQSLEPAAPPNATEQATINQESDAKVQNTIRPGSGEPLARELPAGSESARSGAPARALRGPRRGTIRRSLAPGTGEGTRISSSGGVGEPGVGDTTDAHNNNPNFPPRAGTVTSTRFEHDYRIPDGRVISGSPEVRARNNIAAIETLRTLEKDNRPATVEEQQILAGYVGWGAVPQLFSATTPEWQQAQEKLKSLISEEEFEQARRSTTNAHYTDDVYVDAIWKALQHLGATQGMSWGEPALGSGTFFGRQPAELLEGARRIGIEKDALTAAIAKYLYPDSGVDHKPFEEAELPDNYFDGFVSNVPFGNFGVHDPAWRNRKYLTNPIHNYFFAKSLEYVRPGGVVAFVTSRYTMDGYDKPHQQFRDYIHTKADFLGAVRLPTNAMKAGGTHVITDVIFLRKRLPGAQPAGQSWTQVSRKSLRAEHLGYSIPVSVNEYYTAHPENVLGEERLERGQFTNADYTVRGSVTADSLNAALENTLPKDGFQAYKPEKPSSRIALRDVSNTTEAKKLGGLFLDEKGDLYRKVSKGSAEPLDVPATVRERIKGQLGIRDILQKLVADEQADRPEVELDEQRTALNKAYDRFVKGYGPLSNRPNATAMQGDPDAPVLAALERKYDEKANTAEKAAIFEKRAFPAIKKSESAADAKEALYIALNEKGHIDWNRMQELTGKAPEEMQGDLKGVVFQDPRTNEWELAEEYLSGAVRSKLKEAQKFAKLDPKFHENVEALQQVLPDDIPPSQISALPGVTWVPAEVYSQFAKDVLNSDEAPQVRYVGGEWHVEQAWGGASKWSTADVDAYSILKDTLNLRRVKVHDRDGKLDKQATLAARDKQKQLAEYFEKWLFADADRANQVTFLYNDLINDLRLRTYDGSHLTLPEMSRAVLRSGDLEPYQKAAVWRQIAQRNVLLAHAVGSGKTFEMITGAMELQRLGLIKRPMFVVPNSTLGGWQQQFAMLYPQKRVLVFSEKDLERKNRQGIFAQIQLGDWDAVVVPHSSFQFIPVGDDLFQEHFARKAQELAEAIKDAAEAGADTRLIKRLEKAKEKLLTQMQERRNNARQDLTVSWEQMGIDQLYVDEAHEYKKLGFSTKQQNVAGIDPNGNQKTFDLKMKVDWTQRHGRGVTFATGTPVTNTMGELYNVMQYLIPQELASRGLGRFDEWSANFGRTKDIFEPKPEGGGYQVKPRYAEFVNLQDLGQLFRSFADVLTSDMLDIPRPEFAGGQRRSIVSELTEAQKDIMQDLQSRAAGMRADPRGALPDNMAALYTDAQLMALDARMLDPDAPDEPSNRLNQAANEIYRMWDESAATKGTQLVFADYGKPASERGKTSRRKRDDDEFGPAMPARKARTFSAYDDLIKKLQERGIPANEIAHIYMAKNKAQRAKLFQDVNDGRVRVLIGSIAKMGTGVNVQQRGYGMHFLTLPHRPADLEQAEGRFKRQGNIHKEIHSVYYITKGSLDELKFSGVSRKLKAFNQFMQGKSTLRKMEDVDDMAPSLDQFTAQASGDPRVKRKLEVDNELIRLSELHSAYRDEQWSNQRKLNEIPQRIARAEKTIGQYQSDIATRDKIGRVWTIGKKKMSGEGLQKAAGEAIEQILKSAQPNQKIGSAYGLPLTWNGLGSILVGTHPVSIGQTEVSDGQGLVHYVPNGVGTFTRIENYIKHIEGHVTSQEDVIASAEKDRIALREALEQSWPYRDEYGNLQQEQSELFTALGGHKNDQGADMMDDGENLADESVEAAEPGDSEDENEETGKPKPQSGSGSVTLGSGLGALQPGYEIAEAAARQFVREEVIPKVASMLQGARDLTDTMVRWIDPRRGVPIGTLDAIYRMKGGRDAADYLLSRQLDKWGDRVNRMSQDEMVNFIDRMKAGRPQIDPELQKLAGFLRKMDDELFAEVERYKPSVDYLENHFRVLWKVIPGSPEAKGDVKALFRRAFGSRRPLEGARGFLKQHKLADMTEGLEKGGIPYVYNPVEMFKAHYSDAMKFITAQRLWEQFEKMGVRKFVRLGKQAPEGFQRLDDRIARVYFPVKEGMVQVGEWWVEEGAHRLLKNLLSRDLIREHAFGRALMGIKNGTTAIELGISPFHAVSKATRRSVRRSASACARSGTSVFARAMSAPWD